MERATCQATTSQSQKHVQWHKKYGLAWGMQLFGASSLSLDDFKVEESVVMHEIEVIAAQQYTIQKDLRVILRWGHMDSN